MGIVRVIIVLIIIGFIWVMVRRYKSKQLNKKSDTQSNKAVDNMRKCKVCGVHIPEQESIKVGENYYCSKSHLNADT